MRIELIIIIIIIILLFIISYNISGGYIKKYNEIKEDKRNKYECGIDIIIEKEDIKKKEYQYIKYYLVSLTYLLFDIEIVLLFPYINYIISINNLSNYLYPSFILIFFIFVLIGLALEYINGLFN